MGFRSLFVLMKLGLEVRKHYDQVVDEPIPDELVRPVASSPNLRLA